VLILSQVVLSIQLPLTILPLIVVTGDRRLMGDLASGATERVLASAAGLLVVGLNFFLLYTVIGGLF
jgi:manganese transport protein